MVIKRHGLILHDFAQVDNHKNIQDAGLAGLAGVAGVKNSCDKKSFFYKSHNAGYPATPACPACPANHGKIWLSCHFITTIVLHTLPPPHPPHSAHPLIPFIVMPKKTRLGGQWTQGQDLPQASLQVYCCKQKQQEKEENNGCGIP